MTTLEELNAILTKIDSQTTILNSWMASSLVLKLFASYMIDLSKFITEMNSNYEMWKLTYDNDIETKVMDLMMKEWVKYRNKAQIIAESEKQKERIDLLWAKMILEKAERLYKSYDRLFQVAHTEYRYLAKDMAYTNMHEQYNNMSVLPE